MKNKIQEKINQSSSPNLEFSSMKTYFINAAQNVKDINYLNISQTGIILRDSGKSLRVVVPIFKFYEQ